MIFKISVRAEATAAVLYEYCCYRQDRKVRYVSPGPKNTADENTSERLKYRPFKGDVVAQIPRTFHEIAGTAVVTSQKCSDPELLNDVQVRLEMRCNTLSSINATLEGPVRKIPPKES